MVSPETFAQFPIFADLPGGDRELLAALAKDVSAQAGERVFEEGGPSRKLRILLSGLISLRLKQDDETDVQMQTFGQSGEVFGISALLGDAGQHPYSAVCLEETQMLELDAKELFAAFERKPETGYRVLRKLTSVLGERLAGAREQIRTRVVPGLISHG